MLDSQNKERRRQETHYYAFEVRILAVLARFKVDFGLFRPYRLFRSPADMTFEVRILAVLARFKVDFSLFRPYRLFRSSADMTRYDRYSPILAESARFGANQS